MANITQIQKNIVKHYVKLQSNDKEVSIHKIGKLAGCTPSYVSQVLKKLHAKRYIDLERRDVLAAGSNSYMVRKFLIKVLDNSILE